MYKVGIIGVGFVGGATKEWFASRDDVELFLYDKFKEVGSPEEVNKADIIFVAVPTPYYDHASACHELHHDHAPEDARGYDDSAVWDAVSNIEDGKIVVIKSSVLPGTTEKLQEKYSNKTFLFNPEFLREKTAAEDFVNPNRQIVGYSGKSDSKEWAERVIDLLPEALFQKIMPATEAEMVKFFGNTFLAMRVVFANQIHDLCESLGIDYGAVMEAAGHDPRIGHSHFDVAHGGYRGYGGSCFPKDVKALREFARELEVELDLLEKMDEINENLRKGSD